MPYEKIEEVKKISQSAKSVGLDPLEDQMAAAGPDKERFDSLMTVAPPEKTAAIEPIDPNQKPSLMDEVRNLSNKVDSITKISPKALVAQAQEVISQIDTIKEKLATPNLEIKSSVQTLLRNKLSHIDENIKVALSRAGVEYKDVEPITRGTENPIERFLGFLTDGQARLDALSGDIEQMHLNKDSISPAAMLAIQVKVGYVTQELEFFTSLLNKALESTKTIMNVQV
jgi:hypothetical protein